VNGAFAFALTGANVNYLNSFPHTLKHPHRHFFDDRL
jgi:hypothetical protein